MGTFKIEGGHQLKGNIQPQGAKNEALQILCAVLLTSEKVTISNIPDIVDVNKLNMITPKSIYKEYMGTQDDLVFSHSNYQKGYNISDLLRQDLNYNLKFNHSDKLDVTCSTIFDNISIPQTHYLNAKYTFDNLSELRKEIVQFIHDRQKKHSSNKDSSSKDSSSKDSSKDSKNTDKNKGNVKACRKYLDKEFITKIQTKRYKEWIKTYRFE